MSSVCSGIWRTPCRTTFASIRPKQTTSLYADYLGSPGHFGAVHVVICDRAGELVLVDFQNSHHDDFNQIAPQSKPDCDRLAALRVQKRLH